jgi:predicted O-methyltransferase YrrM
MALSVRLERLIWHALSPRAPGVPDSRLSLLYYDDHGPPNDRLLDLSFQAIQYARREDLSAISSRMAVGPRWPDLWPGEHYKLLAGLVRALQPTSVVEIGTYQGLSALSLAKHLPPGGKVYSYDIVPWNRIKDQSLRACDLEGGRITPIVADLTRRDALENNRPILESAQLLFVDAAKDGRMEQMLLDGFETLKFRVPPLVVFDDIRLWNMLAIWRGVSRPKFDLTSFGHWSGTGLIDWQPSGFMAQR